MFDEVDSAVLVWVRVVVGVAVFSWAHSFLIDDRYIALFLEPRFLLKYPHWQWVGAWPGDGMRWHFIVTEAVAICLMLGLATRLSAFTLTLSIAYVLLVERTVYSDHMVLLACMSGLLAFLPAGKRLSIDARRGKRAQFTFPRWQLWLLRFQLGLPYVGCAVAKLHSDWLYGYPARIILSQRFEFPEGGLLLSAQSLAAVISWTALAADLALVPMLLFSRTRWIGVALALLHHLSHIVFFSPVGQSAWFMLAMLIVFFPVRTTADRVRIFLGQSIDNAVDPSDRTTPHPKSLISKTGLVLATAYALVQVVMPLRPWIIAGDANWNGGGHRFAWRTTPQHKEALTHYLIIDTKAGAYLYVPSTTVLTTTQARQADRDPDMIRQTAIELSKLAAELGSPETQVYALALVSLNGRQPRPMVDSTVDLSVTPLPDNWITDTPGPRLDPPWDHDKEQWWTEIELPRPYFHPNLQGRKPSELQQFLRELSK